MCPEEKVFQEKGDISYVQVCMEAERELITGKFIGRLDQSSVDEEGGKRPKGLKQSWGSRGEESEY